MIRAGARTTSKFGIAGADARRLISRDARCVLEQSFSRRADCCLLRFGGSPETQQSVLLRPSRLRSDRQRDEMPPCY